MQQLKIFHYNNINYSNPKITDVQKVQMYFQSQSKVLIMQKILYIQYKELLGCLCTERSILLFVLVEVELFITLYAVVSSSGFQPRD